MRNGQETAHLPESLHIEFIYHRRLLEELIKLGLVEIKLIEVDLHVSNAISVDLHRVNVHLIFGSSLSLQGSRWHCKAVYICDSSLRHHNRLVRSTPLL